MYQRKAVGSALVGIGLLCTIWGLAIALATISYLITNKEKWRAVDTTGLPSGPMSFVIISSLGIWLAGLPCAIGIPLCVVGIGQGWRRKSAPVLAATLAGAGLGLLISSCLAVLADWSRMEEYPGAFWDIIFSALLVGEIRGVFVGALIGAAAGWAAKAFVARDA